ncbi:hypothetical protein VNO77_42975 [Canavalia gladiata]|uniref:Aminotransferase-like plant mobile domain-containing protein n=1 Tax=Canavalia gladiata TaxID=3824 RepID=A0AAN9PNY6_CANGL
MKPSQDTIIQVKKESMVSPLSGENPTHRTAYFLKPCMEESARDHFLLPHSMLSSRTSTFISNPSKLPLGVRYNGWLFPHEEWKTWVQKMQHRYEYLWIKAGIDQAIKASTYQIHRNDELILELAQRWCPKTNTFIFPWGEATITLEDMKVCWGYSVMGANVCSSLVSDEERKIEEELIAVSRMFFKSKLKRADHTPWMKHFMKGESQVEHEGFLSLWLSRFVFPATSYRSILKSVFPVAIHLARGTQIALAPAVLASIYRDLSLLNNKIRSATTAKLGVILWAPLQLVQVWALERFPTLHPHPHAIEKGQPMARWHRVKMKKDINLKLALDSSGARKGFLWRPYENSPPFKLYNKKDMWICNNPNLDYEFQSYARCLRVSELAGTDCIEQYWPNRVAMQFGMDQDIPGMVVSYNENPRISYGQVVIDTDLYTALCASHQPNVTFRYYHWWKQSNPIKEGDAYECSLISSSEHLLPTVLSGKVKGEGSFGPPPGFTSKFKRDQVQDFDKEDKLSIVELSSSSSKGRCFDDQVANGKTLSSPQSCAFPSPSVEGARSSEDDGNGVKVKNSCCDVNGVNHMEQEDAIASTCAAEIASNLENRIWKLERVIAKIKSAKLGRKVQNIGAKTKP